MKKKVFALFLTFTIVFSLTACGDDTGNNEGPGAFNNIADNDMTDMSKPDKITIMVDGTVPTQENGRDAFEAKLEELIGIDIEIIQPDHSNYYNEVSQTIADGNWPDVIILSSDYMTSYGAEGMLWDMSDAWEKSDLRKRQEAAGSDTSVLGMYVGDALYGMPAASGNGCITYVKQTWLDAAGITTLPTNFDEYYDMLLKMKEAMGVDYVLAASGFLGKETPFVNYLQEFYQDAWPAFYQKEDGTWVDGFEEQAMKDAMARIAQGVADGIIDPGTKDYGTGDVRNMFYEDSLGVFTYWAGTWNTTLKNYLENNGLDGELVALAPLIEERPPMSTNPALINRLAPAWCITTTCEDPEGVFKYFIETMQDGGDIQFLWTYGVEGVHWSTAAETLYAGTDNEVTYAEGEFHMCDNLGSPGSQYTKAHIDPLLALVDLANDPIVKVVKPEAFSSQMIFKANNVGAFIVPPTDAMTLHNGELQSEKQSLVERVALGQMTVDEAYAEYVNEGYADMSKEIVDALNALNAQ